MSTSPATVLLVEDDPDVREEIAAALSWAGYEVVEAADGAEALEWMRAQPVRPRIILLDWMLPKVDGLGFLGQQASDPRFGAVPVVVLSAVADSAKIPSLCVEKVLAKPVQLRTLIDLIDRLTEQPPRMPTETLDRSIGRFYPVEK